jgi:hypothetical protein
MFWGKKYQCEECGKEYRGTHYVTEDKKGNEITICEDCLERIRNEDLEQYEEEKRIFEEKKKSMKYVYKDSFVVEFTKENNKAEKVSLETKIYSDKKLSKKELDDISESNIDKLLILQDRVLSSQKGDIVLEGEKNFLGVIDSGKEEHSQELKIEDFEKYKPKKRIIIEIIKI